MRQLLVIVLLVLLAGLPACAPISEGGEGGEGAGQAIIDGEMLEGAAVPAWLWRGADHPEWSSCRVEPPPCRWMRCESSQPSWAQTCSCRVEPPSALCTEVGHE